MTILNAFLKAFAAVARNAWRSPILNLGVLLAFGFLLPKRYGFDFLDIRLILAYSFIPMLFVGPAVTLAMREGQPARQSVFELYMHVAAVILYGWMIGLAMMLMGLATINFVYHPPELLLPAPGVLPAYFAFSFAAVTFVATLAAYIALLFSPQAALNTLRLGFIVLLVFFYVGVAWLPLAWQVGLAGAFTEDGFLQSATVASAALLLFAGGLMGAMSSRGGPTGN
ncbi:MAG TPA: hypothetical protein VGL53_21845 [Bryobacteraceae bacterium]|jgi:hypothetical protein